MAECHLYILRELNSQKHITEFLMGIWNLTSLQPRNPLFPNQFLHKIHMFEIKEAANDFVWE